MPADAEMPQQPQWLVGGKRGAEETQPALAAGAKSLKATEKGGGKTGSKKGKGGKSRPQYDEHPGATWEGSAEWPAESEGWNWNWKEDEWATGEQTATEGAPATGAGGGGRRPPPGRE